MKGSETLDLAPKWPKTAKNHGLDLDLFGKPLSPK